MIFKLLIVGGVIISGLVLLYPEEIIQFSKGFTIQENTENLTEIKEGASLEAENFKEKIFEFVDKTKNSINSFLNNF